MPRRVLPRDHILRQASRPANFECRVWTTHRRTGTELAHNTTVDMKGHSTAARSTSTLWQPSSRDQAVEHRRDNDFARLLSAADDVYKKNLASDNEVMLFACIHERTTARM
jgi:hypothetical protein